MSKEEIKYALTKGMQLHYIPNFLEKLQGKKGCTYTIEKVLGQGGYGITYLASTKIEQGHTKHKIFYAIKEFFPQRDCSRDEGSSFMKLPEADMAKKDVMTWLDEFEQEAKRLNNVCNKIPHVVKVNEVFRENNTAYYVMEYLNGGSLKDAIDENGMPERKALGILIPIAKTVALLHEQRIIHCDIKDGNIMMNKKDDGSLEPVLIDFGESRHLNADGSLTSKRIFAGGTPGYAPEEQLAGIITEQVDVYALAATLFKMLTGANPQVQSSMTEEYIDKKLPDYISAQTRNAIKHALKHRREDRTNSVKQFAEELEGFIPNELPEGFIITHGTENYQIISVQEITSYYIRYKVNVTRSVQDTHDGRTRLRVIHGRDLYELFDINSHKRNNDGTLLTIGDVSASKQYFLDICKEITKGEISGHFYEGSSLGWVSFASNNTLYIVDNHYRRPLPWNRILTYGGICIGSFLLIFGAKAIYEKFEEARAAEELKMSNRLSDEQMFDSLYNIALTQFDNKQYSSAENIIASMDNEYRSQQQVKDLLVKIRAAIDLKSSEARFDSLYNVAKLQYDNEQYKAAQSTLAKMDGEYLSRPKVKDLLQAIEKAITPTDDKIFQQALRDGNWTVIENLANKGYSKAYYPLAQRYFKKNNYATARTWANKAVKAKVDVSNATTLMGKIDIIIQAEEAYKKAEQYLSAARYDLALCFAKKALSLSSNNSRRLNEIIKECKKWNPPIYTDC